MDVLGPAYIPAFSYMGPMELRLLRLGAANVLGEAGPFENVAAVAVLGAVRRPARR